MARRAGESAQRGPAAGVPGWGNGVPPSTIAAQIVNNHSRANETQEPQNNALFGQLLQEFLTDPSAEAPDVRLNLQLVSVVVEAGFNALLKENPFGRDVLLSQAKDGISVIRITIERNPELLFYHDQENEDSASRPPLVARLLPTLFSLLSRPSLELLHADLRDLLYSSIQALFAHHGTWDDAKVLVETYQACIIDIITSLESHSLRTSANTSFKVSLPPPNLVLRMLPGGQQLVAAPQNCQMEVTSLWQAIDLALALLDPVCKHLDLSSCTFIAATPRAATLDWAADCLDRLWECCRRLKLLEKSQKEHVDLLLLSFLSVLKNSAPQAAGTQTGGVLVPRVPRAFYEILSDITENIYRYSSSSAVQLELSHVLLATLSLDQFTTNGELIVLQQNALVSSLRSELLMPALESIALDESQFVRLHKDLRSAIALSIKHHNTQGNGQPESQFTLHTQSFREATGLEDPQLLDRFSALLLETQQEEFPDNERPHKKPRLDKSTQAPRRVSYWDHLVANASTYLSGAGQSNLEGIQSLVKENFSTLSERDKCMVLKAVMWLPCAAVNTLEATVLSNGEVVDTTCIVCDRYDNRITPDHHFWNSNSSDHSWREAIKIMEEIVGCPDLHRSKGPRVLAATAIRNLLSHVNDRGALRLTKSTLGQWCMKSLKSSLRELRIAAGRALPVFLHDDVPEDVRERNRLAVLEHMLQIADQNELGEQETLILAWGQVARVCGNEELQIALQQLVNYLGHTHPMIYGVAYNELASLAEAFNCKLSEILKPYWRIIGFEVFKDICVRPQKAQQLADLLDMSVNQLLERTQREILPYFVLNKKKDVLKRIAAARNTTVQDVCLQPKENLASILAELLMHPADDIETSATALLCASVPEFEKEDLSSLIKTQPVLIACEILKAAAGEEGARKKQIHQAFITFAMLCDRRPGASSRHTKETKALENFFQNNILGVMADFSSLIDDQKDPRPLSERNRCLGAIEELINLAGADISPALPQIRACLQSALDVPQLCNKAFFAWSALVKAVDGEDVEPLIDQTFSVVVRYWESFVPETQEKADETISDMVHRHKALLHERIDMLPSLKSIPVFSKTEAQITKLREKSPINQIVAFTRRCRDENASVVAQALEELKSYLEIHQQFLHETTISQHPSPAIAELCRAILDASVRFTENHSEIATLAAQCLGVVGCLDPSRTETVRPRREILVLSNFDRADEAIEFVAFMLESVLVKAYNSATNAQNQAFIAYVMQEMLKFCCFGKELIAQPRSSQGSPTHQRWMEIPETIRTTLTPLLNSRYEVKQNANRAPIVTQNYPIYKAQITHAIWLREFVFDLLQRPKGDNAQTMFPVLSRIIKKHDLAIATFLLPFTVVNVILGGTEQEVEDISQELLIILETEIEGSGPRSDILKQCSENVFQVLDYMSKWLQEKRKQLNEARVLASRSGREPSELDEVTAVSQISSIERVLHFIPAEVISRRAVECGSYARALFHWEQYVRQRKEQAELSNEHMDQEALYQHLQHIYTQIDEPDGIEGISAHLQILDPAQQVLEHRRAGRWTAAQSWYELSLAEKPDDSEIQYQLFTCLRESGQYESLLAQVESFQHSMGSCTPKVLSLAAEASWITGKWRALEELLSAAPANIQEFNVGIGEAFLSLRNKDSEGFTGKINEIRETIAKGLSPSATASLQACHDPMLKLHVLYEIEAIAGATPVSQLNREDLLKIMDRRLDVLGAYTAEKQYVLGLRRAAMQLSPRGFSNIDLASSWLTTSRLARKARQISTAFNAVLHATRLGESEAKIEHSRLLWKSGHHRQAIQNLEGAIAANVFAPEQTPADVANSMATDEEQRQIVNKLSAEAYLLKAKWLDQSGQSSSQNIILCYHTAIRLCNRWEKGHYFLGKHYLKLLESDKSQEKVSFSTKCGEHARLIVENYLRGVMYGTKHLYEIIPKVLTLWLDLGMEASRDILPRDWEKQIQRYEREENVAVVRARRLDLIHKQIQKYVLERLPAFVFYTALPQMITRISHQHPTTYDILSKIILRIAQIHPQQSLWSLLAVAKAKDNVRSSRGSALLMKLREVGKKTRTAESASIDLKTLVVQGQRLSEALLQACDAHVDQRAARVSLSRNLGFAHKLAPCGLVVPIEATLVASLPRNAEVIPRSYKAAFSGNVVTISSFSDDVLILNSLQRPRKVVVRGSDGRPYGLLCKPKDDLRKDQRLMEFNAMVNRALLGDVESSKRRLDIRTYAVTPLNEECGACEWVDGLKPMRDIILKLYREKNMKIDYTITKEKLNEACSHPDKISIFTDDIIKYFRPVLHEWFIETYPEPEAWFAARLKYTRSCAVMSIVGHVLGLGDRHGENLLLIEDDGRVFHVDFNCLFDKGLTFEKPELVPFRLTHNMVDAMGAYGVEGPFRLAAELTLRQLRQHIDTLMTILETFLYDPTADFVEKRRKKVRDVPNTPEEVLAGVKRKVKGFLPNETVPLSVEGYVDSLIEKARDPHNLAAMYIGWCAFF